jgi:hypothetical protein
VGAVDCRRRRQRVQLVAAVLLGIGAIVAGITEDVVVPAVPVVAAAAVLSAVSDEDEEQAPEVAEIEPGGLVVSSRPLTPEEQAQVREWIEQQEG